jgi:hypothetical protein
MKHEVAQVPSADAGRLETPVRQQTHDYTRRTWGHDYSTTEVLDGGMRLRMAGWGFGIEAGDFLILPNGNGTTRYRVDSIDYRMDPRDMWFAEASFAPRQAVSAA